MNITHTDLTQAAQALAAQGKTNLSATAADLAAKLAKFGSFRSERQEAFAASLVAQASGQPAKATASLASFAKVKVALDSALARGIQRPALRIAHSDLDLTFKRAPDSGKNPGAIYVTHAGVYLGKIAQDGAFAGSRDCGEREVAALTAISVDPLAAARDSGKLTGRCSCCGRALSDPQSLQLGIGPICADKYFGEKL